jgi:PHD/YefM family antitoxin component YafN of YafNO toxin-antitoxin module
LDNKLREKIEHEILRLNQLFDSGKPLLDLCKLREPDFITKNGTGDLAVMSIETYELLAGKLELYSLIDEGLDQYKQGKVKPMKKSIQFIR